MTENNKKVDTYSYRGWLISDSFMKRCMAVLGYQMVGGMIIYAVLLVIVLVIVLLVLLFGAMFGLGHFF